MAEQALGEGFEDRRIRIKKLFYALRALLACRWIAHSRSQPPTEFSKLVAQSWVSGDERNWIDSLLREKAQAVEGALVLLSAERMEAVQREAEGYKVAAESLDGPAGERGPGASSMRF